VKAKENYETWMNEHETETEVRFFCGLGVGPALSGATGNLCQEGRAKPALKQEELEQLLAPIALYPDSLLTQMLMASTYPRWCIIYLN
jgi:Protein of unknown function (DUF3300)